MRGLTGEHGVMIPVQNVDNLQLSDEIVSAGTVNYLVYEKLKKYAKIDGNK